MLVLVLRYCVFLALIYFVLFVGTSDPNILSNKNQGKDTFIVALMLI